MIIVGISTRVVEELLNSLIASVIKIGTQAAIVIASIISKIAQVGALNIWSNTASLNVVPVTSTVGKPKRTIKILIALINKNGVNAHNILTVT